MQALVTLRGTATVLALAAMAVAQQGSRKSGINVDGIDKTCKPCEDFYQYANGAALAKMPIPARYSRWGTFDAMRDANKERLRAILENARTSKAPASSSERKVGDYYAACMDTAAIDARGYQPIAGELKAIDGIESRAQLAKVIEDLQQARALTLYGMTSAVDPDKPKEIILRLFVGGISLPDRDYYLKDDARSKEIREQYRAHVARMMKLVGEDDAKASATADAVMEMETERAKSRLSRVEMRDPYKRTNRRTLAELEAMNPSFGWKRMIEDNKVPAGTQMILDQPKAGAEIERQMAQAELSQWKAWLRWMVVSNAATELSKPFVDENFAFNEGVLNGVKEQKPRWQVCAEATDAQLGGALGAMFVKKHFQPEAKRRMSELVENLRAALREDLENADWLQPETRANAVRKLEAFYPKIGYPDEFRSYANVRISAKDYFQNVRAAAQDFRRFEMAQIGKPLDRNDWGMTPPTVNAYYSGSQNEIVFPAGILQPPFFDLEADDAANYGAIGAVIGHEMGHGFDDQGSKYAADGSLKNWWTDEDRKKFDAKAQCIIDEFDSLEVGEGLPHHNGKLVTGEALGDLGGVTIAFKAYQRSLKGKPAPVIDGFTGEQRFFLAFARNFAMNIRPEAARLRLQTDPHPLGKFRVNGTVQNVPEFQKAFGCKAGDAMVRPPAKQCKLW